MRGKTQIPDLDFETQFSADLSFESQNEEK